MSNLITLEKQKNDVRDICKWFMLIDLQISSKIKLCALNTKFGKDGNQIWPLLLKKGEICILHVYRCLKWNKVILAFTERSRSWVYQIIYITTWIWDKSNASLSWMQIILGYVLPNNHFKWGCLRYLNLAIVYYPHDSKETDTGTAENFDTATHNAFASETVRVLPADWETKAPTKIKSNWLQLTYFWWLKSCTTWDV